jgi:hypothetical protein
MNSNANASLAEAPFGSVYKVVLSTVTDFMRTKKMARMFGRIKSNRFALAINRQIKEQSYFFFHHISSPNHVQARAHYLQAARLTEDDRLLPVLVRRQSRWARPVFIAT